MSESNVIETPLRPLRFSVGNIPGRLDMTTGFYDDRGSWLENVGEKYGRYFVTYLEEILPNPCEDLDIEAKVRQVMTDLAIYELKPVLDQEAIKDHIQWSYQKEGPMFQIFMRDVWEERPAGARRLYYTPEAAHELLKDLEGETGCTVTRDHDGKYLLMYEFNAAFDRQNAKAG